MLTIPKALRVLVRPEIRALLEKIDTLDSTSDSSYRPIKSFVHDAKLTVLERKFLRNALGHVERRTTLAQAMHIVITNYENTTLTGAIMGGSTFTMTSGPEQLLVSRADIAAIKGLQNAAELERKKVVIKTKVRAGA